MLSLAILAGGKSARMGRDKALMPFLGRPLIQRVFERLESLAEDVFVVTSQPVDYTFLGIPVHPDPWPGYGTLGGLAGALQIARNPFVAVIACDMPFANLVLFEYERDRMIATQADVVIPSTEAGLEPMHAVYRSSTCLPTILAELNAGGRKVIAWLPEVKVQTLPPQTVAKIDPQGLAFWNLNTPEEFQEAEAQARLEAAR
jgi:molybdopterin-guanine dinucleotide biosynthesis protein A